MTELNRIKTGTKKIKLYQNEAMDVLDSLESNSIGLVYTDPPFNTGITRSSARGMGSFADTFTDYYNFIKPHLIAAHRILTSNGSLFIHLDYHEVHRTKVLLDKIFGCSNFKNEIIWIYDFGGRPKNRYAPKHDTILWYTKTKDYIFHEDQIDRIPYMAPGLCGPEKEKAGKRITDCWWNTIVPTQGKERTGYPTQKPHIITDRIVRVHSNPGDTVLDFFAGSGTTGISAYENGRKSILVDNNPEAIEVILKRIAEVIQP